MKFLVFWLIDVAESDWSKKKKNSLKTQAQIKSENHKPLKNQMKTEP